MPLAGQPLAGRILRWLARYDVRHVVLNLHHLPETIAACVGDGSEFGVRVRYSWENPVLGSAGGPRKALPLLDDEDFFIINGDTLIDVDLHALAANHRSSGALVTLAVTKRESPERYAGIVTDSAGIFYGVAPRGPAAIGYHFPGVQIAHPSVFMGLPLNQPAETIGSVYPALSAERRGSVRAFLTDAKPWDVGTPSDYLEAALAIARAEGMPSHPIGRRSRVDASARMTDSVIWDDVDVGAGARLDRCVVADRVKIPPNAAYHDCAIIQRNGNLVVTNIVNG